MITSRDLEKVPLFAGVDEKELRRLASRAADISVEPGEWLMREGEEPRFFVILEGELEAIKEIGGQRQVAGRHHAGEFGGETSIFVGSAELASARAVTKCRIARFERQQLQELVRDNPSAGEIVFRTISSRLALAQKLVCETPSSRVRIAGSKYDDNSRVVQAFLSANRIQYDWFPSDTDPAPSLTVSVDGTPLESPTVRRVAEAIGLQTVQKHHHYDLVIVGAGPAGISAAVYSASEGLKVLLVERFAAGGQAVTSSRIENYPGFPSGISGDELTERALKQAQHFGAETLFVREVERVESFNDDHYVILDGGDRVGAHALLLTTGVAWRRLQFEGHDRLLGRGLIYGASGFDGISVIGKRVFIVGGANSAGQAAVFYAGYAAEVVMLVRGAGLKQSMSQYLIEQIRDKANIRVEPYTQVSRVHGEDHLEQITTVSRPPDHPESSCTREAKALFIMIGAEAKTQWLPASLERDANGYISTGRDMQTWSQDREPFALETSIPGIFCAGDVRHGSGKRIASGVGEGSMAVAYIHEFLALNKRYR